MLPDITTLGAARDLGAPSLVRACIIRADIGPAIEFVTTQGQIRAMFPITGGVAQGKDWTARILSGGADFAIGLPDGSYQIEARYCLEMDDGTPVFITNAGRMMPQADGSYLGRTRAAFEVPKGKHSALGDAVFFGTAVAEADDNDHVYIELWEAPVAAAEQS
jgi:hypothetical protein